MFIKRLSLTNFRNFARLDLEFPRRAVLLVGSNAQGKTSLLEALYFLATFTSFQTSADRQLINFIAAREPLAVARIIAEYERGGRSHRLEVRLIQEPVGALGQRSRKEILLNGVKRSASEAIGHIPAVLFLPQMSRTLEGGPDERRRYLNLALAQAIPGYAASLSEYHQALTQRNALLKQLGERGGDPAQLTYWDETLSASGAKLILWRIQAISELERLAARAHHNLTRGAEVLRLAYHPAFDPLPRPANQIALRMETPLDRSTLELAAVKNGFLAALSRARAEEISRGATGLGPHRDELRFLANGVDLSDYGSRGQIRSALLALKMAETAWLQARTGEAPIVLLDEVLAELDQTRRADLLAALQDGAGQTLITATDSDSFSPAFLQSAQTWHVQAGTLA